MAYRPYATPWNRLMAGIHAPLNDQACWLWKRAACRFGYGRFTLYVPGLQRKVNLMAHVVAFAAFHSGAQTNDELYLAYREIRCCGLELDHGCDITGCINVDHLELVTRLENERRKHERRRLRIQLEWIKDFTPTPCWASKPSVLDPTPRSSPSGPSPSTLEPECSASATT